MKKILTILLVVLLASTTLFAVEFSGRFRAGYTFNFGDKFSVSPWKTNEAKLKLTVSDDAGIWTINIKDVQGDLDSDDKLGANLSLDIAALLAANDVNLGDVSLAISIGANEKMTALSAYNDVTGDGGYKVKNNGKYSSELAVGYGDLIKAKIALDPTVKEAPIVASLMSSPVSGLNVSVAYAHHGVIYTGGSDDNAWNAEHAFGAAMDLNIADLAGLDFDLGLAAYDNVGFNKVGTNNEYLKDDMNTFAASVYGGIDLVDAFFEFRMDNDLANDATTLGMKTQVNFNVLENLGFDVYFAIGNFDAIDTTFKVGGDVSYTISGVEFAAQLEYAGATQAFSVTPKVIVVF